MKISSPNISSNPSLKSRRSPQNTFVAERFVAGFALIGIVLLLNIKAATPTANLQVKMVRLRRQLAKGQMLLLQVGATCSLRLLLQVGARDGLVL